MSTESFPWARRQWPGLAALALAVLLVVVEAVAVSIGSTGHWAAATVLAWAVISLTIVSFLGGLVGVALRRGRRWGAAAMVVSVVANPLVLVWLFRALGNS
ncbi:hypothetical protein [Lacisediminihabitans profunda]|uniref:Uncharacterized protein n=1 Tax=Lacisediminihabitans profunda TaxID=2594790 RepID=A0A5C8UV12_9MICO|nr:hypothetical protein [Lacisediminihabitans profunda]TXN32368.1 hypothetical protein FVP33_01750 [Lacisediminihabitans profunda]